MIDFRNLNTLWASVLVETLHRCGLEMAVICPGSRSTPLAIAFASHLGITSIPILDERSAAFFALGRAKKTGLPTVLVCTSGTAGANFYPAVIEAKESYVPLLILTADRPPELRNCNAGQTIDQVKLYGNFPHWQCELALPEANMAMLRYLRQNIVQAWEQSLFPTSGVVHLNLPFRQPLAPTEQPELKSELKTLEIKFHDQDFFEAVACPLPINHNSLSLPIQTWQHQSGIIIAGLAQPEDAPRYCQAIAHLAELLSFPVFAEALSPIRNYAQLNPYLISTYDLILRQDEVKQSAIPGVIIQVGELPTSKQLRNWLDEIAVERWIIDPRIENFDPLHGRVINVYSSVEQISQNLSAELKNRSCSDYCRQWLELEHTNRSRIDKALECLDSMYEGKAAWLISQCLPAKTPVFIANSMSVRNAEYFWQPNNRQIKPYFSRGANGIDGTLSTALGIAYQDKGILLTGDLALLHDSNGFLLSPKFVGHLTIILINNNGGGIFEMLPIANERNNSDIEDLFESYFATPQSVNFAKLCAAYNIEHQQVDGWQKLSSLLNHLPAKGIRVLEIACDRRQDSQWLQANLG